MTSVRRVLLVQPQAGARWRSITAYSDSLAGMLRAAGVEVVLAAAPWFNPPSIVRGLARPWTRQDAVRRARAGAFDVVHLTDHALAHHTGRFLGHAAVVTTCHDLMPFTTPGYYVSGFEARLKRLFLRPSIAALRSSDMMIAVSQFTAGEAQSFAQVPAERIAIVPNVVRAGFSPAPAAEAEARLAQGGFVLPPRPRVLSVGNDRGYKNLPALFEALAEPPLSGANLLRAGPLTEAHHEQVQRLGLQPRVSVIEGLDDSLLGSLYAACDVLAQPSIAEGFGIPVIEAMACGLPVVTTDGGALPEVVGGAADIVPLGPGFPARFAAALAEAIASRPALSEGGLHRAQAFAPEAVLPRLLEAYAAALARRIARE